MADRITRLTRLRGIEGYARILDRYSEEEFTEIFNTYKAMLPGYTQEEILSEIIQNARAGMNAFGKDVTQYRETVRETYDRARGSAGQEHRKAKNQSGQLFHIVCTPQGSTMLKNLY